MKLSYAARARPWSFALGVVALCALALAVRVPTWSLTHQEPDEVIYWTLATRLAAGEPYGLQGTQLLERVLPADMYDRPLFHHPPLFPLALAPFTLGAPEFPPARAAIVVSWLGALMAVVGVALALRAARGLALWLPVLGMALDPLALFLSRKLWIDLWLCGLVTLGIGLALSWPSVRRPRAALIASGVCLGLAALSKLVAVLAFPVAALAAWSSLRRTASQPTAARASANPPRRAVRVALVLVPAVLLTSAWLIAFWAQYRTLIPSWSAPSPTMLARDPFIALACARPAHYYAARFAGVQPVLVVALVGLALAPRAVLRPAGLAALAWLALFLAVLTWIGQSGQSPSFVRYLAPAFPASYVLLGAVLAELAAQGERPAPRRRLAVRVVVALALVAIALGFASARPYLGSSSANEIHGLVERVLGLWAR